MSYQLSRLDLVVNNATTQITVNTNPSTQGYINGDVVPQDNVINIATTVNKFAAPDDLPAAVIKSISKAPSLTNLTATEVGIVNVPTSEPVGGNGLKNLFTSYYDGITYSPQLLTCIGVNSTSTTIEDLSTTNFTFTNNGTATTSSFAPFLSSYAYSSVLFDGTTQSLTTTVAAGSSLDLATGGGNWTIECWFNMSSTTGTRTLFCKGGTSGSINPSYVLTITAGSGSAVVGDTGGGVLAPLPTTVLANTWYHFALVRSGNIVTSYLNGIAGTPAVMTLAMSNTTNNSFGIGRSTDGGTNFFPGYVSNFRVVKGTALYLGNFAPTLGNFLPVSVSTLKTKVSTAASYTKLTYEPLNIKLYNNLKYSAPTGQTEVYEKPLTVNSYTTVATSNINVISSTKTMNVADRPDFYITGSDAPNISGTSLGTFITVTNTGGALFNGITQYLTTPATLNYNLYLVSFTIECWVYCTSFTGGPSIWALGTNGVATHTNFGINTNGSIYFQVNSGTWAWAANYSTPAATLSLNTWTHVAVVRDYAGGTLRMFINGQQQFTTASYTEANGSSGTAFIGTYYGSSNYFPGQISNFRLVRGVAVYTGNFTPPNTSLSATQSAGANISAISGTQTSLLTLQNSTLLDNSTYSNAITNVAGVQSLPYTSPILSTTSLFYTGGAGQTVSTPSTPAFIRNTTKYNDPTQVEGYFNSFISEHTGEEDRIQAWV